MGDIHLGSASCDEEKLEQDIETIANLPNCCVILMGDVCDLITANDIKRKDFRGMAEWIKVKDLEDLPKRQADEFLNRIKPIKDKILGGLAGNHEETIRRYYSFDVHTYICGRLGIYNMGYVAFSRLRLLSPNGKCYRTISCFTEHGSGGSTTIAGNINRINRRRETIWANIIAMGHVHRKLSYETIALSLSGNNNGNLHLMEHPTLMLITGSYLKTFAPPSYVNYSERMGYAGVPLGCKGVCIRQIREREGRNREIDTVRLREFSV